MNNLVLLQVLSFAVFEVAKSMNAPEETLYEILQVYKDILEYIKNTLILTSNKVNAKK